MDMRVWPLLCRGVLTVAFGMLCGFASGALPDVKEIVLEGEYDGHLQDVWYDGSNALYWAHTQDLLKTDLSGRIHDRGDLGGSTGLVFDGDAVWVGRTKRIAETGKKPVYRSKLVRRIVK